MPHTSTFKATMPMLHSMLGWVREQLLRYGMDSKDVSRCEVALEEVIVNIIHYAYEGQVGDIEIAYDCDESSAFITVIDYGLPFNPLEHAIEHQKKVPLSERKAGGLGILIVQELMDSVSYSRKEGANVLRLAKKLTPP